MILYCKIILITVEIAYEARLLYHWSCVSAGYLGPAHPLVDCDPDLRFIVEMWRWGIWEHFGIPRLLKKQKDRSLSVDVRSSAHVWPLIQL